MIWQLSEDKNWATLRQRFNWVEEMHQVPQDPFHHAEGNVGIHTEMVLNALTEMDAYQQLPRQQQEIMWAAALLHDVEKRSTTHQTMTDVSTRPVMPAKVSSLHGKFCGVTSRRHLPCASRLQRWCVCMASPYGCWNARRLSAYC